ncbi:MAG: dodecin family protein [Microbacterium sp.]|uniref:dodecin n=1 Tax=Microbacterium sp. TaxID=51671 RepID=UPI0039E2BB14
MAHTYSVSEIVGTSSEGTDAAIRSALERAGKTLRNVEWFEVVSVRGHADEQSVLHYQVTLKVGFRLEDPDEA